MNKYQTLQGVSGPKAFHPPGVVVAQDDLEGCDLQHLLDTNAVIPAGSINGPLSTLRPDRRDIPADVLEEIARLQEQVTAAAVQNAQPVGRPPVSRFPTPISAVEASGPDRRNVVRERVEYVVPPDAAPEPVDLGASFARFLEDVRAEIRKAVEEIKAFVANGPPQS